MSDIDVIDDSFDKNITTSYFLSIQVSLNGLSFSVLDPVRNIYILFKHISFEKEDVNYAQTQELLITNPVLNYDYKRVYFLFNTSNATIVPGSLYNYEETKQTLLFNSRINEEQHKVDSQKMKLADAWNMFAIPDFLYYLVKNQYPGVVFFQQYTPQIEANLLSGVETAEPVMYINIQKDIFDIVVLKKYSLLFCNSFKYNNPEEFAYFALNSIKQLNLNQKNLKVILSGIVSGSSSYYLMLNKYLNSVSIIQPPRHFDFSSGFKAVKTEEFYNLFSLPLCV
jgi:hypothetical protein